MRRLALLSAAFVVTAILAPAPAGAQTETFVTGAGEGLYPEGTSYLGVPLKELEVGMGLGVSGNWGLGQFQATLVGIIEGQEIVLEGLVNSSAPSAPNSALFAGTCTVDPGDGTPPLAGVPFTALVAANPDGSGSVTLNLGGTNLPAVPINDGYLTVL